MDDKDLKELLESWIKEIKIEITELNKCGNILNTEISNLKLTTGNLINMKSELLHEIKENKTELLSAFNDLKSENNKKHDKCDARLNELEKSDTEQKGNTIHNKESMEIKLKTIKENNKTLKDNIKWMWRTVVALALSVLYKVII